MGLIGKLFGHDEEKDGGVQVLDHEPEICLHTAAAPEWDNLDDMGKEDLVARYRCPACGEVFEANEFRRMQQDESARMAKLMEPGHDDDDQA